jgi:hypothetical protein
MNSGLIFALFGLLGGLVQDILQDGYLELPKVKEGKFYVGCLAAIVIGAVVGYLVDKTPLSAFLAGYAGKDAIESFLAGRKKE